MNMNALFMRINLNIVYGTQESIIFFLKWRQFIDFAIYKFVVARKIRLTRRFSLFCYLFLSFVQRTGQMTEASG